MTVTSFHYERPDHIYEPRQSRRQPGSLYGTLSVTMGILTAFIGTLTVSSIDCFEYVWYFVAFQAYDDMNRTLWMFRLSLILFITAYTQNVSCDASAPSAFFKAWVTILSYRANWNFIYQLLIKNYRFSFSQQFMNFYANHFILRNLIVFI
jgi:hypothetical protein